MARPRTDAEGPSAKERMREAFWDLLAEDPSHIVSVRELCARAHVNKNAFYYHYANVDELAAEALRADLSRRRVERIVSFLQGDPDAAPATDEEARALRRICLVAGSLSVPALRETLKSEVSSAWDIILSVDADSLPAPRRLDREFVLEGALGVLAFLHESGALEELDAIRGAAYPQHALELLGTVR